MDNKQSRLQNRLGPEIQQFRDQCKTLQLATVNAEGTPCVSYAPFAFQPDGYYILISDIAQHGQNLKTSKLVSIMMVEDESEARHLFARRRLSFDTKAILVDRNTRQWNVGITALQERFGDIIDNLSQLGDFRLYHLVPEKGRYVKGFGKAFDVSGQDMVNIVHLNEGHVKELKESNA